MIVCVLMSASVAEAVLNVMVNGYDSGLPLCGVTVKKAGAKLNAILSSPQIPAAYVLVASTESVNAASV